MNRRTILFAGAAAVVTCRVAGAQTASPAADAGAELYRIDLANGEVPAAEVVIGAVSNVLGAGTAVSYSEGSAPESLVIEYIVTGGYSARGDSAMTAVRADGTEEPVEAGTEVEVAAGDALVVVDNEQALQVTGGGSETASLVLGFFTLGDASGETEVDGDLATVFLGAGPATTLPEGGVTVVLLEGTSAEAAWPEALLVLPVTTETPAADWTFVVLPVT